MAASAIGSGVESVVESSVESAARRYDRAMNHSCTQHALVALGSNLDAPAEQLKRAIKHLQRHSEGAFVCSSIYRTPPDAMPEGTPDFANAVVKPRKAGLCSYPFSILSRCFLVALQTMRRTCRGYWIWT